MRTLRGRTRFQCTARAVQWQVDHFSEVPVLVVACLRLRVREADPLGIAAERRIGQVHPPISRCARPAAIPLKYLQMIICSVVN